TRTAGARIGCQRPSRFWGLGCPKIYHEVEDTLESFINGGLLTESLLMAFLHRRAHSWLLSSVTGIRCFSWNGGATWRR
ncbi:hypothetical protein, partial [Thiolapillus sp.]